MWQSEPDHRYAEVPNRNWWGPPCPTGSGCIGETDALGDCITLDQDNDGICDGLDICEWEDDKIDTNHNGVPDCSERVCYKMHENFDTDTLKLEAHSSSISTTKDMWNKGAFRVIFTVKNISYRLGSWKDKVTISFKDTFGNVYPD